MKDKIFFYRRYHPYGFDELKIFAYSINQANNVFKDTIVDFENWYLVRCKAINQNTEYDEDVFEGCDLEINID